MERKNRVPKQHLGFGEFDKGREYILSIVTSYTEHISDHLVLIIIIT